MDFSQDHLTELRRLLLGCDDRWDSGELARVLCGGLTLAVIETAPGLLALPWPRDTTTYASSVAVRRTLSAMLEVGDDLNLKALRILTETRKPISNRLTEVAELSGHTTSRTARNRLKQEILPWFFDHLIDRLQHTSDRLRSSGLPPAEKETARQLKALRDRGGYRPELQAPIDPADLAQALKDRLVQVALDVADLDEAQRLAQLAVLNGADLIEVGDPLIKRYGMEAVRRVRAAVPGAPLVVEFSSSDWVDDQVGIAAEAGADLIYILGVDNPSRVERAVRMARSHRVGIVLTIPAHADPAEWCATVANAGVDAISVIRNIDSAESLAATTARMRQVAGCATIPLVIAGGFNPANVAEIATDEWSVLIVGAAFIHARDPGETLQAIRRAIEPSE